MDDRLAEIETRWLRFDPDFVSSYDVASDTCEAADDLEWLIHEVKRLREERDALLRRLAAALKPE
jgi:hypothetical protein